MTDINAIAPIHQWTHDGDKVLLLKVVKKDGKSISRDAKGFQWPTTVGATVEAPDAQRDGKCGGGLHGWCWGLSVGDGLGPDYSALWIVFAADPADVIDLGGKAKAVGECQIVAVGTYLECYMAVLRGQISWTQQAGDRAASTSTGDRAASASTGDRAASTSTGYMAASASTGDMAASTSTGDRAASTSTGNRGIASATGVESRVECGPTGIAAATCDPVWWVAHPGAVLVQRTDNGIWLIKADDYKITDGELLLVEHGVVWQNAE